MTRRQDVVGGDDEVAHDTPTRQFESGGAEILRTLRSTPALWLPFLVAGCVLTAIDRLRMGDPLPIEPTVSESSLQIAYTMYPTGATATERSLDALVDLPPDVFVYAIGIELLAIGTIAAAGWITMVRVSNESISLRRFLVYLGGVSVLSLLDQLGTVIGLNFSVNSLLVAIGAFTVLAFVAVRLFFLPIAVLCADPLRTAPWNSWRRSRGHGLPIFILVTGFGLVPGWLVSVPYSGVVLSVTVVGTVHAVALAVLYELYE